MKNTLSISLIALSILSQPAFAEYPEFIKSNPQIKPIDSKNPNPIHVAYSPTDPNWEKVVINKDVSENPELKGNTDTTETTTAQNLSDAEETESATQTNEIAEIKEEETPATEPVETEKIITQSENTQIKEETKVSEPKSAPEESSKSKSGGFSIHGFQLGAAIGLLNGASAHIGYRIPYSSENFFKNRLGFRLEYNSWKPLQSTINKYLEDNPIEIDGNDFIPELKGKLYGALIDFYPFSYTPILGNIRISTGYYKGDFSIAGSLSKDANEIFSMKDKTTGQDLYYKVDGHATLNASLDYDINGPYAGLGFDFSLLFGFKLYFDAGLVFTEKPKILTDINGSGNLTICGNNQTCSSGQSIKIDSSNEQIQKLLADTRAQYEDELDVLRKGYYPIVKLGLLLRF